MHQLWNGIAQNYKDQFWRHLAEIFKRLRNSLHTVPSYTVSKLVHFLDTAYCRLTFLLTYWVNTNNSGWHYSAARRRRHPTIGRRSPAALDTRSDDQTARCTARRWTVVDRPPRSRVSAALLPRLRQICPPCSVQRSSPEHIHCRRYSSDAELCPCTSHTQTVWLQ